MSSHLDERGTNFTLAFEALEQVNEAIQHFNNLLEQALHLIRFVTMDEMLWEDSPFYLGEISDIIGTYQLILGMPETGVWTVADEERYVAYVEKANWMILGAHVDLPRNWWGSFKTGIRTI